VFWKSETFVGSFFVHPAPSPPHQYGLGWVRGLSFSHPLPARAGFRSSRPSWIQAGWVSICCLRLWEGWAHPLASRGVTRYGQKQTSYNMLASLLF